MGTNDWTYIDVDFNSEDNAMIDVKACLGDLNNYCMVTVWFDYMELTEK